MAGRFGEVINLVHRFNHHAIETNKKRSVGSRSRCDANYVRRELDRVYDLGVRHFFILHNTDNQFGGTAIYNELFNAANFIQSGKHIETGNDYECWQSGVRYSFHIDDLPAEKKQLAEIVELYNRNDARFAPGVHCNAKGLSTLGQELVAFMIRKRVIIDADHLSNKSFADLVRLAKQQGQSGFGGDYPLLSGHTGFRDLHFEEWEARWLAGGDIELASPMIASETTKSPSQVEALRDLGGMVSPILVPYATKQHPRAPKNDCPGSTKTWAQAYLYAVDKMGGRGIGFASDTGGMTKWLAPRFGSEACAGAKSFVPDFLGWNNRGTSRSYADFQKNPVRYLPETGGLEPSVAGNRTFNYNTDGFAQIGMLPDFIVDLKNIGMSDADMQPLFRSAEDFLQAWEKIEGVRPRGGWGDFLADRQTEGIALRAGLRAKDWFNVFQNPTSLVPISLDGNETFVLAYDAATGRVSVDKPPTSPNTRRSLSETTWSTGWSTIKAFYLGGQPHIVSYKPRTGQVDIDRVESDGRTTNLMSDNWGTSLSAFVPFDLVGALFGQDSGRVTSRFLFARNGRNRRSSPKPMDAELVSDLARSTARGIYRRGAVFGERRDFAPVVRPGDA